MVTQVLGLYGLGGGGGKHLKRLIFFSTKVWEIPDLQRKLKKIDLRSMWLGMWTSGGRKGGGGCGNLWWLRSQHFKSLGNVMMSNILF